jgi:hypothetical protein
MSEEAFQFLTIYFTMFTCYLELFFKWFYSLDIHPMIILFGWTEMIVQGSLRYLDSALRSIIPSLRTSTF